MRAQAVIGRLILGMAIVGVALSLPSRAGGQTTVIQPQSGVAVDAQGVLQVKTFADPGGQLTRERIAAARTALDPKVTAFSKLRKISLNRLEEAIRQRQGALTDEMRNLAGLLRVRYIFYYPETKDIVIAGQAEGWMTDVAGRVVGITTRRPVVTLEDLVVALRAFPPGKAPTRLIGCSIDPTDQGLAAMQQFLRRYGTQIRSGGQIGQIVEGLQTSLGPQTIRVDGIPPNTHFAQTMVEADYRMKLIGIGLERPPVRLISYVDRASPAQVSRNALERWYFTPDYQSVRVAEDRLAMELVGDGVKLIGEGELVSAGGQRQGNQTSNKASQAFVAGFTQVYAELADRSPVFAQLRNLIDLAVAAAFLQQEDLYGKADWKMPLLGDEKGFAVETYNPPRQVAPAINVVARGNRVMTPIGGGVSIDAARALSNESGRRVENGTLDQARKEIKLNLAKGQWWWD